MCILEGFISLHIQIDFEVDLKEIQLNVILLSEKSKGWTKNLKLRVTLTQALLSSMGDRDSVAEPGAGNRVRARLEIK